MNTKKSLIQIRTNANFALSYKDSTLVPEIELIMLFVEPKYEVNKKGQVEKGQELNEFRLKTSLSGISQIIGELQALQVQMKGLENMSEGINAIIKANTDQPSHKEGELPL